MKKVYIICLIFIFAVVVFGVSYYYSKNNMGLHDTPKQVESQETPQVIDMTQTALNEARITNITEIIMQTYDLNNKTFSEEKINTPVEFLEMEREDLINYMKEYLSAPSEEDSKRGLVSFELVQFSREEVVMRKTFDKVETAGTGYYGVVENGYVTIYESDLNTIYDYTDIAATTLPENVKEQLTNRLEFGDIVELYEFLETYTS